MIDNNVVPFFSHKMTVAEYAKERAKLAPTKAQAGEQWERDLAMLFARSGWTQDELAKEERISQQHIARLLRFGRFLNSTPMGVKSDNLSERGFRDLWDQTEAIGEDERFRRVLELSVEAKPSKRRGREGHGDVIGARFADGDWHRVETMAAKLKGQLNTTQITKAVREMVKTPRYRAEDRPVGKEGNLPPGKEYRFFSNATMVSVDELRAKLKPIIKALRKEGEKKPETMSVPAVAERANELQRLLDELTK